MPMTIENTGFVSGRTVKIVEIFLKILITILTFKCLNQYKILNIFRPDSS